MEARDTLLVELLVEELPPKALRTLGLAFGTLLVDSLRVQGLAQAGASFATFASPRRLAVQVPGVAARAADRSLRSKLMPVAVALDAGGQPTLALLKKLAALGLDAGVLPKLERALDGKAEAMYISNVVPGALLVEGLQKALAEAIAKLPIPKLMQYQLADGWSSVHFVRPAHGLVALHGAGVVPVAALGLAAGRLTRGHRFEAAHAEITLLHADSYAQQLLEEGAVIAGFEARRDEIERQLAAAAAALGLVPIDDPALLDEVTALVERPNVLPCRFEPEFLALPPECLILTLKANQKVFPLLDAQGALTNQFLVVSNIRPADPRRVIEGNERVVRPRLADAKFFFDQDRKKTLESRVAALDRVVYHGKLGSQGQRVQRVRRIAAAIDESLTRAGGEPRNAQGVDPTLRPTVDRAALLAKTDLLTDMVGEFPELQGFMGGCYARHDGETEAVALAIEDHYKPRFAGDELPRHPAGVVLALADKLETLAGLFGVGQLPSGDKDPYALRRHALGVLRMLIERGLPLDVPALVDDAFAAFGDGHGDARQALAQFLEERLAGYLRERHFSAHEIDAVTALRPPRWADIPQRLAAVRAFASLPEAAALAAANKRVGNILRKTDAVTQGQHAQGQPAFGQPDPGLLVEPAEAALAAALAAVAPLADAAFEAGDYSASLQALAALRTPVDAFFESVMVNADDPALRRNRLALLSRLHVAMNRVADLSRLAG